MKNETMKDVKRFVKKVLILIFLLCCIVLVLNYVGIQAGKIYKDGAALVCESKREMVQSGAIHYKKNKINVLFMGTSRMLAGIVPAVFDRLSGGKTFSYNLAFPALPISSAYFTLKDYLEKNPPPEYVVMQLHINRCRKCTLFNYYASQGFNGTGEMASLVKNMENKSIIVNYLFPFKMYKFFVFRYVIDRILRPSNILQIKEKNRAILEQMTAERGFYFIEEQAVAEDNRLPDDFVPERKGPAKMGGIFDPFTDPYVEKFFELTRETGVKVLLIQPVYRVGQYLQYEQMPLQFSVILEQYDHVFAAEEGWKRKFYDYKYFADKTHLNPEGAERFTTQVFNEFQSVFPGICGE
ncbi:MAG: DUF1574 domain-containing protein [Candidatus Aminicenantes bacterium]|nr:DUF1574 domain-containing protein [Candidatus Aminicenantes bacterium]NIM80602.1 DUF1574 domain-containing protein [Candidatus Aminicenantes bacterium]NIN19983.1 DUF1574 domain-containing protein [Candidatus Aminicenantes bacterium]NIN42611.1 DUF1574 domain-containing protein [Candidatus Aminicenantes bacterium]NIN86609.1 DUF1574 domain-containing protein [Candidatus Aminicenantes bacterium]